MCVKERERECVCVHILWKIGDLFTNFCFYFLLAQLMDLSLKALPATIEVISSEEQTYPHIREVKQSIEDVSGERAREKSDRERERERERVMIGESW